MGLKVSRYARVPISQERYAAGWHRGYPQSGVVIDPFIEHGLVTRTEGRSIERTELTVDVGGTYPSHGEVETFPVERCVYAKYTQEYRCSR